MKRLTFALIALLFAGVPLFADPLDVFTLSGDGHTFQFSTAAQQTVSSNPHLVELGMYGAPGTVDGATGYSFASITATRNPGNLPLLLLTVSPLPPGSGADPFYGGQYMLYGPTITTLIADTPDPYTDPGAPMADLLTFAYVPGSYSFLGYNPAHVPGSYSLQISAGTSSGVTPEPASWLLLLPGLAVVGVLRRRHGFNPASRGDVCGNA